MDREQNVGKAEVERLAHNLWKKKKHLGILPEMNRPEINWQDAEEKLAGKDREFWSKWQV